MSNNIPKKIIVIEVDGGVATVTTPEDQLENIDVVIIDHDNLPDEISEILANKSLTDTNYKSIYLEVIEEIKKQGSNYDLDTIVEKINSK